MDNIPAEINSFYEQLEEINSFDKWELIEQIKPLSDMYSDNWKHALVAEQIVLRFVLNEGKLKPIFIGVSKDGKEVGFPSINEFSEEAISYLKGRAEKTKNHLLVSRYNHILFDIEKNRNFAIKAIEAYKQLIHLKRADDIQERFIPSIQAVLKLTEKSKYKIDETKEEFIDLIHRDETTVYNKYYIVNELIESSLFKSYELRFVTELCLNWLELVKDQDYFYKKRLLLTAIRVGINNDIDSAIFYEKLAENEDLLLEEHVDDSDFLKPIILADKMEYFKKAENTVKYEETSKEYTRVKSQVELTMFEIPIEGELHIQLNEEIRKNVQIILSWDIDKILAYFSTHSPLFPDIKSTIASATENYNKSFTRFATTNVFDINVNSKTISANEGIDNEIFKYYQLSFGILALPEFLMVLQHGVFNGKISYYHVYQYLHQNSWYGQRLPKMKMRVRKDDCYYNWLDLFAPALHSFFSQIEASFLLGSDNPYSNWVLSIDSLTLKFEGALRDFVRLLSGSTSIMKKDEVREMLLEYLLDSDIVKKQFTDNDLALFKMIFTKKGENIRNNVAHCFYQTGEYRLEMICKIFLCVLRLGKYKLKPVSENE